MAADWNDLGVIFDVYKNERDETLDQLKLDIVGELKSTLELKQDDKILQNLDVVEDLTRIKKVNMAVGVSKLYQNLLKQGEFTSKQLLKMSAEKL